MSTELMHEHITFDQLDQINELSHQQLIEAINFAGERQGNLTILFTNALASRIGLSATEFECLSLLREGPLTAGTLALRCGLTTGAITGLIDRLERGGFVERRADPKDRRRVLVAMKYNRKIRDKVIKLYEPVSEGINSMLADYSDDELRAILSWMIRANKLFDDLTLNMASQKSK